MYKKQFKLLQNYIKYSLNENKEYKTDLDVFDFDATLYNTNKQIYDKWIYNIVNDAKDSIRNYNSISILCTARSDEELLVNETLALLQQKNINFERKYFKDTNKKYSTAEYKSSVVAEILFEFPNITCVNLWEDNEKNIRAIQKKCEELNVDFNFTLV